MEAQEKIKPKKMTNKKWRNTKRTILVKSRSRSQTAVST
jgi:hypothetical protein